MACIDTTQPPMELLTPSKFIYKFPRVVSFLEVAAIVTANDIVLLDVDETIMFKAEKVWASEHLRNVLRIAKFVMFVTARIPKPSAFETLQKDLAKIGIVATKDHMLFTGDVAKGRYVRVALAARGLGSVPGWCIDDNRDALCSVSRYVPHLKCLEFRGQFRVETSELGVTPIVLAPLPAVQHPDFDFVGPKHLFQTATLHLQKFFAQIANRIRQTREQHQLK
jgi:hypothetical protein